MSEADSVSKRLAKAVQLVASMQSPAASVRRTFYESLTKVFGRIRKEGKGDSVDFDLTDLKSVLFGSDEVEALRLTRAEAIKSIRTSSSSLMSKLSAEIFALTDKEKSAVVRDQLLN